MTKNKTEPLILSALFLALGIILPFFTGQSPQIGSMLLPMHIPVFLCAFICERRYSITMAFILPLIRTAIFSRPNFYPEAIAIAFELAAYSFTAGLMYNNSKHHLLSLYRSLITAMTAGRIVRCVVQLFLLNLSKSQFIFKTFLTGTILAGIPGIILQLIVIPAVMVILRKTSLKK